MLTGAFSCIQSHLSSKSSVSRKDSTAWKLQPLTRTFGNVILFSQKSLLFHINEWWIPFGFILYQGKVSFIDFKFKKDVCYWNYIHFFIEHCFWSSWMDYKWLHFWLQLLKVYKITSYLKKENGFFRSKNNRK